MEIEQEKTQGLDGKHHPTGEYTLWITQEELNALVDVTGSFESDLLEYMWGKLRPYATDRS